MLRLRPVCCCWLAAGCILAGRPAAADQPGFSQIEVHDPFSSRYVPLTPVGWRSGRFGSFSSNYYYLPGTYPLYPSLYSNGPTFGPYFAPLPYGGMMPPVWIPAGAMYGPQAVKQFIGADNLLGQPVAAPQQPAAQNAGFGMLAPNPPPARPASKPRATNAEARARSQRFIVLGDGYFAKQGYSDASQRYKLAAQAAPDMADGFLRQGIAHIALGHYEAAARSLKRGLLLKPDWAATDFQLSALYADNALAKAAHLEALAQEAARAPSSDILFLLGVMLYFDGQRERAQPIFVRARELSAGDDAHLDGFLRQLLPAAPGNQAPAPIAGGPDAIVQANRPAAGAPTANAAKPFSKMPTTVAPGATRPRSTPSLPQRGPAAGTPAPAERDL